MIQMTSKPVGRTPEVYVMRTLARRRRAAGQALPLLVGGLVGLMMMVSLIVDGGNVWAQQRIVQNGADAASEAGTVVLARRLSGNPTPSGGWDAAVSNAVATIASANNLTAYHAYYTDVCGQLLTPLGTVTTSTSLAAAVGGGFLPIDLGTSIGCASNNTAGVYLSTTKGVRTYIANVVGITSIPVGATATSVTGFLQGACDASGGGDCNVLPVAFPVAPIMCTQLGSPSPTGTTWPLNTQVILPLCNSANGDVGWLNWTPPGGGTDQLKQSILTPNNPAFALPSWNWVPETGAISSKPIEDALNTWIGKPVLIPLFDASCSSTPDATQVTVPTTFGCPATDFNQGNGVNVWYRIPQFGSFVLQQAYTNGQNQAVCDGAKECLVGEFVSMIKGGVVGPGVGGGSTTTSVVGVQLLK